MIATIQGQTGPQVLSDGAIATCRVGKTGELSVQELHGRYYEQAYRGNVFSVASQAVATTTVGLATTYTGLCLSNPLTSPVNLSLLKCTVMQSVIQATQIEAFAIAFGSGSANVTHTTPATPQPTRIGSGATANAKADTAATIPIGAVYGAFVTNTATAVQNSTTGIIDFEGSVILTPGAFAFWATPGQASVAGMWFSFMWEEVPV